MKYIYAFLTLIFVSGSVFAESECEVDLTKRPGIVPILEKNLGDYVLKSLTDHFKTTGISLLNETLYVKVTPSLLENYYSLKGSVMTSTNQELDFDNSDEYLRIYGVALADEWYPDGSALNPRCELSHFLNQSIRVYNSKTKRGITNIYTNNIPRFEVYKMYQ